MTWKITSHSISEADLINEESLFFLGNGYIGVRGNFEEGYYPSFTSIRGTYINAFHDITAINYGEKLHGFPSTQQKMVNVIDSQTIAIYLDGERFSIFEGELISYQRTLHLDKGFAERRIHWRSPTGKEVVVIFKRLVSFIYRELFVNEVTVEPVNFSGDISFVSTINGDVSNFSDEGDPRVAAGDAKRLHVKEVTTKEDAGFVLSETETSNLKTACLSNHNTMNRTSSKHYSQTEQQAAFTYSYKAKPNEVILFMKKNIYVDTLRHGQNLAEQAEQISTSIRELDFNQLLKIQEQYLQEFWQKSDVEIDGDYHLQEGIRFNLFHLLQSAGRDKYSNISAKGLSGEGYEGHYFWDTEIYMFPVFLMSDPNLAKQLLIYRYSILENAKKWARTLGHQQGALFPWRTITGEECSSYFPSGSAQYHISADIAYSYIQYYQATNDWQFMIECGVELLCETARLWMDTGHFRRDGGFVINDVTGPDEYTCIVNNNYYTNVMAKHNLRWAAKLVKQLQSLDSNGVEELMKKVELNKDEVNRWEKAAKQMVLPYDRNFDINPQDDSFLDKAIWNLEETPKEHRPLLLHYHPLTLYRYQVCKQADTVLAHFLLEDDQNIDTIRNSYNYYEEITTHDSSLSTCVFSIMASKLGDLEKAYQYFKETARLDLDNTHGNTKDGLHMANMGGTWMAIVFGFAGLRIKENGIHLSPQIPKEWNRYSFHFQYKNQPIKAEIVSKGIFLHLMKGPDLTIWVNNQPIKLTSDKLVKVS
ncbi:family 65 glycosyl hydrolase [Aquibacillus halophilus]|uniref:Family 65 glycosyl hydrolase n=1 Tax=Aquibacillus halophilus TaxID=930132 RepID=A0A6A8DJT8_9BACI|nr:glycosyl hydrolase family 65 protein [Aquibacillus halophilus]MRH44019.1 family 65 glycosyl hydrolase [Aquibacillus halophilus]